MEKHLNYILMLPLKEMALRKIAVVLINQPDILDTTERFPFETVEWYQSQWLDAVEEKITDKIFQLELPELLAKQMLPILKAVGTEILKWKSFHKEFLCDEEENCNLHVVEKLCWTTAGSIDDRKTAETIVRSDVLDIVKRFKLACLYCLEEYIPLLWKELPEEKKKSFCNEGDISQVETPDVELFLPFILKNPFIHEYIRAIAPQNSFEYSALCGLKTLAQHCFRKLPEEKRAASLFQTAIHVVKIRIPDPDLGFQPTQEKVSDVLCYLLSLMTPEDQMRIFRKLPCEVLSCFLDWPWQEFFLDTADVIWTFLPKRKHSVLLRNIMNHIDNLGFYFPSFFREFFLRSPKSFKKSFIAEECIKDFFLRQFFCDKDSKSIEVIFRNIDAADKMRLIFSEHVFKLFNDFLLKDSWDMVEVCIREAALSKENKKRLKAAFVAFATKYDGGVRFNWRNQRRKRLFDLLDEMDAIPADKRSTEDETPANLKKLCTQ